MFGHMEMAVTVTMHISIYNLVKHSIFAEKYGIDQLCVLLPSILFSSAKSSELFLLLLKAKIGSSFPVTKEELNSSGCRLTKLTLHPQMSFKTEKQMPHIERVIRLKQIGLQTTNKSTFYVHVHQ